MAEPKGKGEVARQASAVLAPLATLRDAIEKQHGSGSAMLLSDKPKSIAAIPTGSVGLDLVLGVGGWPRGRIIELYGEPGVGKSSLMLHAIANAQRAGILCAFVDAEHALDLDYARALDVDPSTVLLSQPDWGEQALAIVLQCVPTCGLVVVDSVAALTPKAEIDGEMGDSGGMALHARMMSHAMRKLVAAVTRHDCCLIFSNQTRSKVGIIYGSPITTTGGNALRFYASVRAEVKRIQQVKKGEDVVGGRTVVKIVKSRVAPPFRQAEFDIRYGIGIDACAELIEFGEQSGVLEKSGNWYAVEGQRFANGREAAISALRKQPDLQERIRTAIGARDEALT